MKYLFCIVACSLLSSACGRVEHMSPIDRSVTVVWKNNTILGNGVLLWDATLLTATHILRDCEESSCQFLHQGNVLIPRGGPPLVRWDITRLPLMSSPGDPVEVSPSPQNGDHVFLYRSLSGTMILASATVIDTDASYIWYNKSLATHASSWAIVIDLWLSLWESGTPIWDERSRLIGIVSATDQEKGVSYILRP